MAELPDEVMPGELISSEWINGLLAKLGELDAQVQQLSGSIPGGTVIVPNLFGKTLGESRQLISLPALQLALGNVLDAYGANINPNVLASASLVVIGQYPVPNAKAFPGSAVNLVVAATPSTGSGPTSKAPTITAFTPTPTPLGQNVDIIGTNFIGDDLSQNQIFFNEAGPFLPLFESNEFLLKVKVPTDLDDAPVGNQTLPVEVRVVTPNGEAKSDHIVTGALPGATPDITAVEPIDAIPFVGQEITIVGTDFSATAAQNRIHFDSVFVQAKSATGTTRLRVDVPNNIPGLTGPGAKEKIVSLRVEVQIGQEQSRISDPFPKEMQKA
jgi:hypothetical protein